MYSEIKMEDEKLKKMYEEWETFRKDMNQFLDDAFELPNTPKGDYDDFVSIFEDLRNNKINLDKAEKEVIILFGVVLDEVSIDYRKLSKEQREEHDKEIEELEKENDRLRDLNT